MALGKSLDNILGDYFGEEVVDLKDKKKSTSPNTPKESTQSSGTPSTVVRTLSEGKTVVKDIFYRGY